MTIYDALGAILAAFLVVGVIRGEIARRRVRLRYREAFLARVRT